MRSRPAPTTTFAGSTSWAGWSTRSRQNFPQREIADASYELQQEIDAKRRIVVGVNAFTDTSDDETPLLRIDPALERRQIDRLQGVKARREGAAVEAALSALKGAAAQDRENLMPHLIDCARAYASEGEIIHALQDVYGTYTETPVF